MEHRVGTSLCTSSRQWRLARPRPTTADTLPYGHRSKVHVHQDLLSTDRRSSSLIKPVPRARLIVYVSVNLDGKSSRINVKQALPDGSLACSLRPCRLHFIHKPLQLVARAARCTWRRLCLFPGQVSEHDHQCKHACSDQRAGKQLCRQPDQRRPDICPDKPLEVAVPLERQTTGTASSPRHPATPVTHHDGNRRLSDHAARTVCRLEEGLQLDDHGRHVVAALAIASRVGGEAVVAQGLTHPLGRPACLQALPRKRHSLHPRQA